MRVRYRARVLDLPALLTQIALILLAARGVGFVLRRFSQPQVVGEMLAGILLGPSLLGLVAPSLSASLFPEETLPQLAAVSQVGVVIFMFLMGLEVDPGLLRERGRTALITSQAGILVPFASGALLGLFLYPAARARGRRSCSLRPLHGHGDEHHRVSCSGANSGRARTFGIEPRHLGARQRRDRRRLRLVDALDRGAPHPRSGGRDVGRDDAPRPPRLCGRSSPRGQASLAAIGGRLSFGEAP